MLREVPLSISDGIDCIVDHSSESEDEDLKQDHYEGYSNTNKNIVVGVVVAESELIDSLGNRKLAIVGMPALVGPTC